MLFCCLLVGGIGTITVSLRYGIAGTLWTRKGFNGTIHATMHVLVSSTKLVNVLKYIQNGKEKSLAGTPTFAANMKC